jgi:hypothetical protein
MSGAPPSEGWLRLKRRMIHGPRRKLRRSAVIAAYALRNVMYRKTLKTEIASWSG